MNPVTAQALFHSMLRIRRVEEAVADRYSEQEMRCPMHLCIGQEAIAAGVCASLAQSDLVFSNHRAHGHYLAKGGSLDAMVAELYGRSTGCCGGRGGSMHLIDLDAGFMGATPIVGGTVPLAAGAAWKAQLKNTGQVVAVFFGDGCFEEGVVHETMNFASLHKLPILFICENNRFSVYTRREERQAARPIFKIAEAHGMQACVGNGNDVEEVFHLTAAAVEAARSGQGPQFLEFHTYRWREHCGPNFDDDLNYRSIEEIQSGRAECPIESYRLRLAGYGLDLAALCEKMERDLDLEIKNSFDFALASGAPCLQDASGKVYA